MNVAFGTGADGSLLARLPDRIVRVPGFDSLDALLARPRPEWLETIASLDALDATDAPDLRLPFMIGDYVDFYSSLEHATFFGKLLRPQGDPLTPNWRHMPVGYHGRSSTIVVSGTPIRRPVGQKPELGPTRALDVEVELGWVIGGEPNEHGQPIPIETAAERIFGVVILNDWSARDIQRYEGQPLGPFLSKAFATSISAWVVPIAAIEDARVRGPKQDPPPQPYLASEERWNFDIELTAELNGEQITKTNARTLYWNAAQQLAHLGSVGAVVRPGDLLGTGTISGGDKESGGSLMEMGRPFLNDGDEIVMRGQAGNVELGEVRGKIEPPRT